MDKKRRKRTRDVMLLPARATGSAADGLRAEGHDPLRELIQVAQGKAPVAHPTVSLLCEFLTRLMEAPGVEPGITTAAAMMHKRVMADLIGYVDQSEIDKINLALMAYAYPPCKAEEAVKPEQPVFELLPLTHCPHCLRALDDAPARSVASGPESNLAS